MKTTLTSILSVFALPLLAQVTIDQSNFPRPAGFVDAGAEASVSGVALPTEGAGQTWDYSALTSVGNFAVAYMDATSDADYPTALNYRELLLTFQAFGMNGREYEAIDADGWHSLGRSVMDTTHSITAISGGANDVLNFPDQANALEGRWDIMKFPASFNDSWSTEVVEQVHFNLTVAGFGLNNTPGVAETTISETRTVVGEGTLVIPDANGNPSGPLDAILIKVENRMEIDSFFLGGQLAPVQLLTAFGVTQGMVTESPDYYVFYVPDFNATALNINLNGSGGVSSVYYRPSAAALATSIGDAASLNAMRTFPNPIAAGEVMNIDLSDNTDATMVELIDLAGRQVFAAAISGSAATARVALPSELAGGMYTMVVSGNNAEKLSVSKLMVK
jgi:hypothetical protein